MRRGPAHLLIQNHSPMPLRRPVADEVLPRLLPGAAPPFDAVIDARSPGEFAEDRLPGALNWPVLDDAQRAQVGTLYHQVSAFDARRVGAALVARNIAGLIDQHCMPLPRSWRPLVYCWRGGQRSGALATVLSQIGFSVQVLEGGYREFRRAVLRELQTLPAPLPWRVLLGRTGSAKTRLLGALAAAGHQVLDLEALAAHRGSLLGALPGQAQPSQKAFETRLWQALRSLDPARPVWTEGESRTIGRLRVPDSLVQCLRNAPCTELRLPLAARVDFLLHDYAHFVADTEAFCERLASLRELRGARTVQRWQVLARAGDNTTVVTELLQQHYDPGYNRSMQNHFSGFETAAVVELPCADDDTLKAAAVNWMP